MYSDVSERMDQFEAEKIQMQAALTDITKKMVVLNRVREFDIEPRVTTSQAMNNKHFDVTPNHTSREAQCQEQKMESKIQTPGLPVQSKNRIIRSVKQQM